MNNVWLTRTCPSADESALAWQAASFEALVDPLLEIEPIIHDRLPKDAVIIFTSKNGIDHIKCGGQRAICVGDVTAAKAKAAGYNDVISVDGTSADVTVWVKDNLSQTEKIFHVSGWHVRGTIVEDLVAAGYSATRVKVYRSAPSPIWPDHPFSYVAFYSPLAAQVFTELAIDLCKDISELIAICISQATADELSGLALQSILIADRPREDELIMAAKTAYASTLATKG